MRSQSLRTAIVGLLALPGAGLAQDTDRLADFNYNIGYRGEHQSNPELLAGDEQSDISHALLFGLTLDRESRLFDFSINADGDYLTYQDDTFDEEFRLNLTADALWRIVPERLHWVIENESRRAPLDPRSPFNLGNQQQTNLFTTGPDLLLRLNSTDRLTFGARYADFYAEDTNDDSEQVTASATWARELTSGASFGFRLQSTDSEFSDQQFNEDFQQTEALAQYSYRRQTAGSALNEYRIEAGYSTVDFDNREDLDSPVLRVGWNQNQPNGTQYNANLEVSIGTGANVGGINQQVVPVQVQQNSTIGDPFEQQRLSAGFDRPIGRFNVGLDGEYGERDYDTAVELDDQTWSLGGSIGYSLNSLMQVSLDANVRNREFVNTLQEDRDSEVQLRFDYQRTRRISYELSVGWVDRDSTVAEFDTDNVAIGFQVVFQRQ